MKIGILTFQFADNYGALLQAYALKNYIIENFGCDVEIINYINSNFKKQYSMNPLDKLKVGIKPFLRMILTYSKKNSQHKIFTRFRNEYILNDSEYIETICFKNYDCVIVGSDQVWNTKITMGDMNYFLPTNDCYIVSYAASADDKFLNNSNLDKIIKLIENYNYISVRESTLQKQIQPLLNKDVNLVADPVFLYDKINWTKFGSKSKKRVDESYVLYYALAGNDKLEKCASELAEQNNCKIIIVHPTCTKVSKLGHPLKDVGPIEFVWLLEHAKYVISNSFHAFAFSIIFNKTIYYQKFEGTSNRVQSLIDYMNLKPQIICDGVQFVTFKHNESLKPLVKFSKEYLKNINYGIR